MCVCVCVCVRVCAWVCGLCQWHCLCQFFDGIEVLMDCEEEHFIVLLSSWRVVSAVRARYTHTIRPLLEYNATEFDLVHLKHMIFI